jgi:hypothetical protein
MIEPSKITVKTSFKYIIAIDPGKNGGMCLKTPDGYSLHKMPESFEGFSKWVDRHAMGKGENTICFIERISAFAGDHFNPGRQFQLQKLFNMYQKLRTYFQMKDIPCIVISPPSWQNGLNLVLPKEQSKKETNSERKNRYKNAAKRIVPSLDVFLWGADAVLIMAYAKRKMDVDNTWILTELEKNTDNF